MLQLIISALMIGMCAGAQNLPSGARLHSNVHEFGVVLQSTSVEHAFLVRNEGTAALTLRVAGATRGLNARYPRTIAAGEEGAIHVRLDTRRLKGDVDAQAVVLINGDETNPLTLSVKGIVQEPLEILPLPAFFISVWKGESVERTITLVNHLPTPLAIARVETEGPHFTASARTLEAGQRHELTVALRGDATPGRYKGMLLIHTDPPASQPVRIPVHLLVKDDVWVTAPDVNFGGINRTELSRTPGLMKLLQQTFVIRSRTGTMELLSAETDVPGVTLRRDPENVASEAFRVDAGVDLEHLPDGDFQGYIRIKTSHPSFPEIVLPVKGSVQ